MNTRIFVAMAVCLLLFGCEVNSPEPSIPSRSSEGENPDTPILISGDGRFSMEVDKDGVIHIVGIDRYVTSELSHKLAIRVWSKDATFNIHNCKKAVVGKSTKANIYGCQEVELEEGSFAEISSCEILYMRSESSAVIRTCNTVKKESGAVIKKQIDVPKIVEITPNKVDKKRVDAEGKPEVTTGKPDNSGKQQEDIDLTGAPSGSHQMI